MFLQNFMFVLRHIAGKDNVIADYLSRMFETPAPSSSVALKLAAFIAAAHGVKGKKSVGTSAATTAPAASDVLVPVPAGPPRDELFPYPPEYYLSRVHGGRRGHFGIRVVLERLHREFPGHRIPVSFIRDWIAECETCQKMRLQMTSEIQSVPRNLGVSHARVRIGVDRMAVTPPDDDGNCNVISIVEFFTGFYQAYPSKDYTAVSLATVLFRFYCTFGTFDEIASDPGSDLMSEAVALLHQWLGMRHVVSLVDRHESNGVERHNRECLRHLRALVFDERLKKRWGEPTTIALINFLINDLKSRETGVRPFDAKFGSFAGTYCKLPSSLPADQAPSRFLKIVDEDLAHMRSIIQRTKTERVLARLGTATEATQNQYQPGDFVLVRRETPAQLRPEKLQSSWSGPFKVVEQVHNDVSARHCATDKAEVVHVDRCKPFFGTEASARDTAMRDQDQFEVDRILAWRGDPNRRKSLQFLVLFADGDTSWNHFCEDLWSTQAFAKYCSSLNVLRGLLFKQPDDVKRQKDIRRRPIDKLQSFFQSSDSIDSFYTPVIGPGVSVFVDLRSWSDASLSWYYDLELPEPDRTTYVVLGEYGEFMSRDHRMIKIAFAALDSEHVVESYWVYAHGMRTVFDPEGMVLVDEDFVLAHPNILPVAARKAYLKRRGR
jgi:hypothetical protein